MAAMAALAARTVRGAPVAARVALVGGLFALHGPPSSVGCVGSGPVSFFGCCTVVESATRHSLPLAAARCL